MRAFMHERPVRHGTRVGETFSIPLDAMNATELEDEQKQLTLQARNSFGVPPPAFEAWFIKDERFHVPRFYGLERYGTPVTDERVLGDEMRVPFVGTLTDVQKRAVDAAFTKAYAPDGSGGALISLPCGMGKTVLAVHVISRLGRKACILVHKSFLRDQWKAAFERFCPGVRVGFIQGKVWQVEDCDVVIAMIMTMAKRDLDASCMECFGTICVDECHHVAAPVMNMCTRIFRARYVLALTATKDRPDGLTPLLHWSLGAEVFQAARTDETVRVTIAVFRNATPELTGRDGKPLVSTMINRLAACAPRNAFLVEQIVSYHATGRVILVLSDRIEQLKTLAAAVRARVPAEDVGFFSGQTKEADRPVQLERRVVFCSYGMANEGLDKREADTCIMATPKSRVIQCIGRIQRPCASKQAPLVLDVVDDLPIFNCLRWKRQRMYSAEKYEVQVRHVGRDDGSWFQ